MNGIDNIHGHTSSRCSDVYGVIITYRPDISLLRTAVTKVADQTGKLLIFDNASRSIELDSYFSEIESESVVVFVSSENIGLGAAMNHAARNAMEEGFKYLLLLDQDSIASDRMVATLRDGCEAFSRQGIRIGAVGPQFVDRRTRYLAPFIKVGFPYSQKLFPGPGAYVECDFLISSGSLLPLLSFAQVGEMDEGFFIDNVDLEWCFRARQAGFRLFGLHDAQMAHSIGDSVQPSRFFPRGLTIHSPLRFYYITRNRLLLYGRKSTPLVWIAQDFPRLLLKFLTILFFPKPRMLYFRYMFRGILDALRGKTGPHC